MKRTLLTIASVLLLCCMLFACSAPAPEAAHVYAPEIPETVETPAPALDDAVEIKTAATPVPTPEATLPPPPTPTPTPDPTPTPEPTEPPTPTPTPRPLEGIVIGIDPGHQRVYNPHPEPVAPGSKQTKQKVAGGCRGIKSGVYEYDVAQSVGLYLKELLEEQGATVVLTHETVDVDISNAERAKIFNEANVDLGIRLHLNQSEKREIRGAFMLAPKEHRTKFYDYNVTAARIILDAYLKETGLPMRYKDGMTYRGDQTGFNWCTRPIINIEMGHLSNADDDALISTEEFQKTMAQGLANGFVEFFREYGPAPDKR